MSLVARFRPTIKCELNCTVLSQIDHMWRRARIEKYLVPTPPAATIGSLGTRRTIKGGAGPPLLHF